MAGHVVEAPAEEVARPADKEDALGAERGTEQQQLLEDPEAIEQPGLVVGALAAIPGDQPRHGARRVLLLVVVVLVVRAAAAEGCGGGTG